MKLTDEQRAALDRHWKELFEEPVTTEIEMVAYGYFKRGYAAAKNETCEWAYQNRPQDKPPYYITSCSWSLAMYDLKPFCEGCGRKVVERDKTGENYAE